MEAWEASSQEAQKAFLDTLPVPMIQQVWEASTATQHEAFLRCLPTPPAPSIRQVWENSTLHERQEFLNRLPRPTIYTVWAASDATTQNAFTQHVLSVAMENPAFAILVRAHQMGILEPTFGHTVQRANPEYPITQPLSSTIQNNFHVTGTPAVVRDVGHDHVPNLVHAQGGGNADQVNTSLNHFAPAHGVIEPIEDEEEP